MAGGCDFVRATLKTWVPASMQTTMVLDILTYDAFPALAVLEDWCDLLTCLFMVV